MAAVSARMGAGHGGKRGIATELAQTLGCSLATAYRHMGTFAGPAPQRKRRADAGDIALPRGEAAAISAYAMETRRANGKMLACIENAVATLRANGEIFAGRVDEATGEFRPLSVSAISRALYHYNLHPEQLIKPAPKRALASGHPNHAWQIDPSLCVLYYLKSEAGLRAMKREEFYDNKPKNFDRIAQERVWRYVVVDHASGAFYVEYVLGAESGLNLCNVAINAMQPRGNADPLCGVPRICMVDPGSANTGAMFRNLCAALGIELWINQPHQPWAKGSVEKHNDIIERQFEHRLALHKVDSLDDLNAAAWRWMRDFNATVEHTRHKMSRYAAWATISADQLKLPPTAERCRVLAMAAPMERVVDVQLHISLDGRKYSVANVPGVIVGQKIQLTRSAWGDEGTAHVLGHDADGHDTRYVVQALTTDAYGFTSDAVPLGTFRALPATAADDGRAEVERAAMRAGTDAEAAAKRKAGALPFDGDVDPYKSVQTANEPAWLKPRGAASDVAAPDVIDARVAPAPRIEIKQEFAPVSHIEAAMRSKRTLDARGLPWRPEYVQHIAARWPDGVPYDQVDALADELVAPPAPPHSGLRLIDGGVA